MSMNVLVMSPHYEHTGCTTIASLLAIELAQSGRKTCLTHSSSMSKSIYSYFDISEREDKTASPARLVKMIREGAIKPEDLSDYCKGITDNLEIFSANSLDFLEDDMEEAIKFITMSSPHEFLVVDMDSKDLGNRISRYLLRECDVVVLVVNQDLMQLEKFKDESAKIMEYIDGIPTLVVVNRFHPAHCTIKQAAKAMGVGKPKNWYTVRYNPYITRTTNFQELKQLAKIFGTELDTADVESDMRALTGALLKVKVAKRKANIEAKKNSGK